MKLIKGARLEIFSQLNASEKIFHPGSFSLPPRSAGRKHIEAALGRWTARWLPGRKPASTEVRPGQGGLLLILQCGPSPYLPLIGVEKRYRIVASLRIPARISASVNAA